MSSKEPVKLDQDAGFTLYRVGDISEPSETEYFIKHGDEVKHHVSDPREFDVIGAEALIIAALEDHSKLFRDEWEEGELDDRVGLLKWAASDDEEVDGQRRTATIHEFKRR